MLAGGRLGQMVSDRKRHVAWKTLLVLFLCCTAAHADGYEVIHNIEVVGAMHSLDRPLDYKLQQLSRGRLQLPKPSHFLHMQFLTHVMEVKACGWLSVFQRCCTGLLICEVRSVASLLSAVSDSCSSTLIIIASQLDLQGVFELSTAEWQSGTHHHPCIIRRSERYIEDTDRFPGWKGELPVPIMDFKENNSTDASAPPLLTIGLGADGKVVSYRPLRFSSMWRLPLDMS